MPNRSSTSSDLKNIGLKATVPRLKVLEIFQRSTAQRGIRHMSAEDVYKALIAEHIDVGLATVYRVLTQFEQAGCCCHEITSRAAARCSNSTRDRITITSCA